MAEGIAQWLERVGLGQYAQVFAENDVDTEVLAELTDADLKDLGLSLGHRRKLLKAMADKGAVSSPDRHVPEPAAASAEAERRQLTVLFCDLVGSTELSARLDPEDMREVLRAYQNACSKEIARYEGYVAKFMGDGVYAYFGYPIAHEDDAERAIAAGLGIVEAIADIEHHMAVRIGIATGNVAVGDLIGEGASEEANVVGEAPNLAARLQAIAEPDTVIIGEATHTLAGGMFETTDLGGQHLKGFANPMGAWRVLRASTSESRFQATHAEHLTELVGREEEMEILLRRWERAKAGDGQLVLITGEPGIGKSRLLHALREHIAREAFYVRIQQCSPHYTNSAFSPFTDQTARAIGLTPEDSNAVKIDKLEAWIRLSDQPVEKCAPLFGSVLGIDTSERYPPLDVSPQRHRELLFKAFAERLTGLAAKGSVLYAVEDCHWLDPTSLEQFSDHVQLLRGKLAVLAIATYRPEFEAPWVGQSHTTVMTLGRLDRSQCAVMVSGIGGDSNLANEVVERIAERTDGVPLFVEELTRAIIESSGVDVGTNGASQSEWNVPTTLQDALEARLDRLGTAKEIAQIGAVIGRTFDYDLLFHVAGHDEENLSSALEALVSSGLMTARGIPPNAAYSFKHALVQDTAYASLLRGRKRELHRTIARALEQHFPDTTTSEPEVIGFHYAEAGDHFEASAYYTQAGEQGYETWAVEEGLSHLNRALELVKHLPENRARLELETDLYRLRGLTLKAVGGIASKDALADLERSLAIGRKIGKTSDVLPVLANMANTQAAQGLFEDAARNTQTLFELAHEQKDIAAEVAANFMQGIIKFHTGDTDAGEANFRRCMELSDPSDFKMNARTWTFEPAIGGRFRLGNTLLIKGYPDQAKTLAEEALSSARKSSPLALVSALMFGCFTLVWRGDVEMVRDWSEEAQRVADEYSFAMHLGWSTACTGWAQTRQGNSQEGLKAIQTGIERFRDSGRKTWLAWWLMVWADAELQHNGAEKAEGIIEEALIIIAEINENQFLAPANSLKGDVLFELGRTEIAEKIYMQALEIARSQSAKSWELRASIRLARLWQSQDKATEAHDLLAPVYGWFTEGFDTADLKEAKTLLDELG